MSLQQTTDNKKIEKKSPEVDFLEKHQIESAEKSSRVSQMEELIHDFDVQAILDLNDNLRIFYKKVGDTKALDLLDQMTIIMNELTEIISQVKAKRKSLEQGEKEIREKLAEVNQVLESLQGWEATGI